MTHLEEVKKHLQEHGKITSWEAIERFGCTRLSAVICELRKEGINIKGKNITAVNRFGHTVNFTEYSLEE